MMVAIPSARYMALGSSCAGLARSLAVKVMMPKPRKAKKVSATLDTISDRGGYPAGASSAGLTLASVTTAKNDKMPTTTYTMMVCAFATRFDPTILTTVMATMMSTAKILIQ